MFNVSRITSKRALDELESEKLIYRKRGKGTYVSPAEQRNSNEGQIMKYQK
jgi:GntR family transcriptional regulator, arabinose operon transcriptional repressor